MKIYYVINGDYQNQASLFSELSSQLQKQGHVTSNFEQALLDREEAFPTGLPTIPAVAIPHTNGDSVLADCLVFIKNRRPLIFGEMGGAANSFIEVRIIILLVINQGQKHLHVLQQVIEQIQVGELQRGLLEANTTEEMKTVVESRF